MQTDPVRELPCLATQEPLWHSHLPHLGWDRAHWAPHSHSGVPHLLHPRGPTAESQTSRPLNLFDLGAITRYQNKCPSWCLRDTRNKTVPHCQPWGLTALQHAGIVLKNPSFFEINTYFSGHGGSLNREAQNVQCQSAKEVQPARRCLKRPIWKHSNFYRSHVFRFFTARSKGRLRILFYMKSKNKLKKTNYRHHILLKIQYFHSQNKTIFYVWNNLNLMKHSCFICFRSRLRHNRMFNNYVRKANSLR